MKSPDSNPASNLRVWDPLVRLFHWSLVAGVALAWMTSELAEHGDDGTGVHLWVGYVVAAIVAARVLWGFVGPRHARFTSFVRSPAVVAGHARQMWRGDEPRYIGHNPLGGWMIVALLLTLAGVAATGWAMTTDRWFGSEVMEDLHEGLAGALPWLVAAHVGGVVWTGRHHAENLVRAMFTGRKRAAAPGDID
jgi:cytochrome b